MWSLDPPPQLHVPVCFGHSTRLPVFTHVWHPANPTQTHPISQVSKQGEL